MPVGHVDSERKAPPVTAGGADSPVCAVRVNPGRLVRQRIQAVSPPALFILWAIWRRRMSDNKRTYISAEAEPGEIWVSSATWEDCCRLRETNGNTSVPPTGAIVIWGLRSTATGRWVGNDDVRGVPCLQVFRSRELAEQFQSSGNEVVWMGLPLGGRKLWTQDGLASRCD